MVKWTGKLAALVVALSVWGTPLLACMQPDALLTVEERACCRQMADDCGQMDMPDSHSCCKVTVRQGDSYLVKSRFDLNGFQPLAAALITGPDFSTLPTSASMQSAAQAHSPPVSPPGTLSILRI